MRHCWLVQLIMVFWDRICFYFSLGQWSQIALGLMTASVESPERGQSASGHLLTWVAFPVQQLSWHWRSLCTGKKRNKRRLMGQPTERQMWGDGSFLPWVGLGLAMPREAPFWAEIFYKNIYIFEVKFCMLEKSPHLGKLLHSWWDSLAPHRWQWTALLQARELPVAARNLLEKVSWPKWQGNMGLCPDVTVVEAGEKQCSSQYLPSSCWERCTGFSWHSFHSETPLQHVSGLRWAIC